MLRVQGLSWLTSSLVTWSPFIIIVVSDFPQWQPARVARMLGEPGSSCDIHSAGNQKLRARPSAETGSLRASKRARCDEQAAVQPVETFSGHYLLNTLLSPVQLHSASGPLSNQLEDVNLSDRFDGSLRSLASSENPCQRSPCRSVWIADFSIPEDSYNEAVTEMNLLNHPHCDPKLDPNSLFNCEIFAQVRSDPLPLVLESNEANDYFNEAQDLLMSQIEEPTSMDNLNYQQALTHHELPRNNSHSQCPVHDSPQSGLLCLEPPKFRFKRVNCPTGRVFGPQLLSKYLSRFDEEIKTFYARRYHGGSTTRWFDGVPVAVVSSTAKLEKWKLPSVIRLKTRAHSSISQYPFAAPSSVKATFHALLKCLLFDLAAILSQLKKTERFTEDADSILTWLVNEFFQPTSSLPVMGDVKCDIVYYDWRAFGPVQKLIIDSLYREKGERSLHRVASNILGIWYKNFDRQTWNFFEVDQSFWLFVQCATAQTVELNQTASKMIAAHEAPQNRRLGDFEIFDLEEPPCRSSAPMTSRIPKKRFREAERKITLEEKKVINVIENEIISMMYRLSYECQEKTKPNMCSAPDVLVGLVASRTPGTGNSYVLRLLSESNTLISPYKMNRKLSILQHRLHNYSIAFLAFLKSKKKTVLPHGQTELAKWLKRQMFKPDQGLPLFGIIYTNHPYLHKDNFGQFQHYLINCLCKTIHPADFEKIFSTIIGYWYKTDHRDLWNGSFSRDKEYWEFMTEALKVYEVPRHDKRKTKGKTHH